MADVSIDVKLRTLVDDTSLEHTKATLKESYDELAASPAKGLQERLDQLKSQDASSFIPDFANEFKTQVAVVENNISKLISLYNKIGQAQSKYDRTIATNNYIGAQKRAAIQVGDLEASMSSMLQLQKSLPDHLIAPFVSYYQAQSGAIRDIFKRMSTPNKSGLTYANGQQMASAFAKSVFGNTKNKIDNTDLAKFINANGTTLAQALLPMMSYNFNREDLLYGINKPKKAIGSVQQMLPQAFQKIRLSQTPEYKTASKTSEPLTAKERANLRNFVLSNQDLLDEFEASGIVKRRNGSINLSNQITRQHVNAFGGQLAALFEAGARGIASTPSKDIDDVNNPKYLERILGKNNKSMSSAMRGMRIAEEFFPWMTPDYIKNPGFTGRGTNIGKVTASPRYKAASFALLPFDGGEVKNLPVTNSLMQQRLASLPGADKFVHNGRNSNEIHVELPIEKLQDFSTSTEEKAKIKSQIAKHIGETKNYNGNDYVFTGFGGTSAIFTRKDLVREALKQDKNFFTNGEDRRTFESASAFGRAVDYMQKQRTDGEDIRNLFGTDLSKANVVVADWKKIKSLTGEEYKGADGQNLISDKMVPVSFQGRDISGKSTYYTFSEEGLRKKYSNFIDEKTGDLVFPTGGIGGKELRIPKGTSIIEDWNNIKANHQYQGMTQEEINAARTADIRRGSIFAKTTSESAATEARFISSQAASSMHLDEDAREYFRQVYNERMASLRDPDSVKRLLFSGTDPLSQAIQEDESLLYGEAAQKRIKSYAQAFTHSVAEGNLPLPESVGEYRLLGAWIPDIFNGLAKGDPRLTEEQKSWSLRDFGDVPEGTDPAEYVKHRVAYYQSMADKLMTYRNPNTASGNQKVINEATTDLFKSLAKDFGIDENAIYTDPASAILNKWQTADYDGDTVFVSALKNNGAFGAIMASVLTKTAMDYQNLVELSGRTPEQQEAFNKTRVREIKDPDGKVWDLNNPEDLAEWFIRRQAPVAKMGAAHAVSIGARQYAPSDYVARAIFNSEGRYDVDSNGYYKNAEEWEQTYDESRILGGGNPFYRLNEWRNKFATTEDAEAKTNLVFQQDLFNKKKIDAVNFPSIFDSHGIQADFNTFFAARNDPERIRSSVPGANWEDIFANLPTVSNNEHVAALQNRLRGLKQQKLEGKFLGFDDDLVQELGYLATNAYNAIEASVKSDASIPMDKQNAEIERRFREVGGLVPKFIRENGETRSNIAKNPELQREFDKAINIYGENAVFAKATPGLEIPYAYFSSEEIAKSRAESKARIEKEKKEALEQYQKEFEAKQEKKAEVEVAKTLPEEAKTKQQQMEEAARNHKSNIAKPVQHVGGFGPNATPIESDPTYIKLKKEHDTAVKELNVAKADFAKIEQYTRDEAEFNRILGAGEELAQNLRISGRGKLNKIEGTSLAHGYFNQLMWGQVNPQNEMQKQFIKEHPNMSDEQKRQFAEVTDNLKRNMYEDFSNKGILYAKEYVESIQKELTKETNPPSKQKTTLEGFEERAKEAKGFVEEIDRILTDGSAFTDETSRQKLTNARDVITDYYNKGSEVNKQLREQYTKENEQNAQVALEALEGRLGYRDKNSAEVLIQNRKQLIQDQMDLITGHHKEGLLGDKYYEDQMALLKQYQENAEPDILDKQKLEQELFNMRVRHREESIQTQNDNLLHTSQLSRDRYKMQQSRRFGNSRIAYGLYSIQERKLAQEEAIRGYEQRNEALMRAQEEIDKKLERKDLSDNERKDLQSQKDSNASMIQTNTQLISQARTEIEGLNSAGAQASAVFAAVGQSLGIVAQRLGRQLFRRAIQETKQFVKQFDSSMNEIQAITLKSDEDMATVRSQTISRALGLRTSVSNVATTEAALYRQGLSDQEVAARTESIIKFATVTKLNVAEATKVITTALQNDLTKSATEAMDTLVALGDNAATTAAEIGKGMQKAAAAAKVAGVSYSELTALLTIGTSDTQLSGTQVGTALQTVFTRMRRLSLSGYVSDQNGEKVTANEAEAALKTVGVDLWDNKAIGKMRTAYDVLLDLSKVWQTLSDAQKNIVMNAMAGTRQTNVFATLMEGMSEDEGKTLEKYLGLAENSEGITQTKYEIAMQSLAAAMDELKSSWDGLVESIVSGGSITGILDTVSGFLQLATNASGIGKGLGIIAAGIAGVMTTIKIAESSSVALKSFSLILSVLAALTAGAGVLGIFGAFGGDGLTEAQRIAQRSATDLDVNKQLQDYRDRRSAQSKSAIEDVKEAGEAWEKLQSVENEDKLRDSLSRLAEAFPSISGAVQDAVTDLQKWKSAVEEASEISDKFTEDSKKKTINAAIRHIGEFGAIEYSDQMTKIISDEDKVTARNTFASLLRNYGEGSADSKYKDLVFAKYVKNGQIDYEGLKDLSDYRRAQLVSYMHSNEKISKVVDPYLKDVMGGDFVSDMKSGRYINDEAYKRTLSNLLPEILDYLSYESPFTSINEAMKYKYNKGGVLSGIQESVLDKQGNIDIDKLLALSDLNQAGFLREAATGDASKALRKYIRQNYPQFESDIFGEGNINPDTSIALKEILNNERKSTYASQLRQGSVAWAQSKVDEIPLDIFASDEHPQEFLNKVLKRDLGEMLSITSENENYSKYYDSNDDSNNHLKTDAVKDYFSDLFLNWASHPEELETYLAEHAKAEDYQYHVGEYNFNNLDDAMEYVRSHNEEFKFTDIETASGTKAYTEARDALDALILTQTQKDEKANLEKVINSIKSGNNLQDVYGAYDKQGLGQEFANSIASSPELLAAYIATTKGNMSFREFQDLASEVKPGLTDRSTSIRNIMNMLASGKMKADEFRTLGGLDGIRSMFDSFFGNQSEEILKALENGTYSSNSKLKQYVLSTFAKSSIKKGTGLQEFTNVESANLAKQVLGYNSLDLAQELSGLDEDQWAAITSKYPQLESYMRMTEEQKKSVQGQNMLRDINLEISVAGVEDLENANKVMQGTADLIKSLQQGGEIAIKAKLDFESKLYNLNQQSAVLQNGTLADQYNVISAVTGLSKAQIDNNFIGSKSIAERILSYDRDTFGRVLDEMAIRNPEEAEKIAQEYGYKAAGLGMSNEEALKEISDFFGHDFYYDDKTNQLYTAYQLFGETQYGSPSQVALDRFNKNRAKGYSSTVSPYAKTDNENIFSTAAVSYTNAELAEAQRRIIEGDLTYEAQGEEYNLYKAAGEGLGKAGKDYMAMLQKRSEYSEEALQEARRKALAENDEAMIAAQEADALEQAKYDLGTASGIESYAALRYRQSHKAGLAADSLVESFKSADSENIQSIMDVLSSEEGLQNWKDLLEATPELTKEFKDMGHAMAEDGSIDWNAIKEQEGGLSAALSDLISIISSHSEEYKNDEYKTRSDIYNEAQRYLNGAKDEASYNAYADIVGADIAARHRAEYNLTAEEQQYAERRLENYRNGITGLTQTDKLEGASAIIEAIKNKTYNDIYGQASQDMIDDYVDSVSGLDKLIEAYKKGNLSAEDFAKQLSDVENELDASSYAAKNYGDHTEEVANNLKNLAKGGKAANQTIASLRQQLAKYNNIAEAAKAAKAGKNLNTNQLSDLASFFGDDPKLLKEMTKEQLADYANAVTESMDQEFVDTIGETIQGRMNELMANADPLELDMAIKANVSEDGTFDLSAIGAVAAALHDEGLAQLAAYAGTIGELVVKINKGDMGAKAVMELIRGSVKGSGSRKGGGSGGGGGKSEIDKLLEKQKHEIGAIQHKSKMLEIEEKGYDFVNNYSGQEANVQEQIGVQEELRSAYRSNISEMNAQLAKVKQGTDDWWKLTEAIQSAEESLKEIDNTIRDLNSKKIEITQQKQENEGKPLNHRLSMLQKYAGKYQTLDNFESYELVMNKVIEETRNQITANDNKITEWEALLLKYEENSDDWLKVRDNIWAMREENADLENQVLSDQRDLNEARISQIATDLQNSTSSFNHANAMLDTYGQIYQDTGNYEKYRQTINSSVSNVEEIRKLRQDAMNKLKKEITEMAEDNPARQQAIETLYEMEEQDAQDQATLLAQRKALEESFITEIEQKYDDKSSITGHEKNLLQEAEKSALRDKNYAQYQNILQEEARNTGDRINDAQAKLQELLTLQNSGKITEGSDEWRHLQEQIHATTEEIASATNEQQEFYDKIATAKFEEVQDKYNEQMELLQHRNKLIQYIETDYQNNGELTNYGTALTWEKEVLEEQQSTLEDYIKELKKQQEAAEGQPELYKRITDELYKAEELYTQNATALDKLTLAQEKNQDAIRKAQIAVEKQADKAIRERVQKEKDMLNATVSIENSILSVIRKNYQDQWDLEKKTIERKKQALQEEKNLINERLNARKNAVDEENKYEELAEYQHQLALISADTTRTKEQAEIRRKIADLQEELSWDIATQETNAQTKAIDDQLKAYDDYVSAHQEDLTEMLSNANNFREELDRIMNGSFEDFVAWNAEVNEDYIKKTEEERKQMEDGWHTTWRTMKDELLTYWDEVDESMRSKDSWLALVTSGDSYLSMSEKEQESFLYQMGKMYDDYQNSLLDNATFDDQHKILQTISEMQNWTFNVRDIGKEDYNFDTGFSKYVYNRDTGTYDIAPDTDYAGVGYVAPPPEPSTPAPANTGGNGAGNASAKKQVYYVKIDGMGEVKQLATSPEQAAKQAKAQAGDTYGYSVYQKETDAYGKTTTTQVLRKDDKNSKVDKTKKVITGDSTYASSGDLTRYADGGLVDFTGPAWVDGTKTNPESFLDATDTALLRSMLDAFTYVKSSPYITHLDDSNISNSGVSIGDVNVNLYEAKLENDADYEEIARKVGDAFNKQLQKEGFNLANYNW